MPSGTVPERKPDYFIGSTGRPILTSSHFTAATMHRRSGSGGRSEDGGARNSKLSKHLHNLTIRNGAAANDRHGPINSKAESGDITTAIVNATGRRGSTVGSSGSSGWSTTPTNYPKTGSRSSGGQQRGQQAAVVDRNRSVTSPAPRLLSARGASTARSSRPTEASESCSLVLRQQCRYSNHHKQLDNRLSYQRSYDRNIFGYDQRMDQFVLPPLQI
uniref:Uncharacterized protein n=1 Tax=Anopheles dirus TaxID=7168 RepID=A0A182MYZ1_9DIPT